MPNHVISVLSAVVYQMVPEIMFVLARMQMASKLKELTILIQARLESPNKPNNWWVQIVKQKYLRQEDFLGCKVKQNHSLACVGAKITHFHI
ncbi:hypothetical protein DVH24_016701 [Malus domestica]|uniref:Uncharacterized protein n=1 Tax=Malus domestica TaxID=3750 RepID=A0A498HSW3_MALDO|nr:hypothetical protein DVH24_016701 [Malus domestica]